MFDYFISTKAGKDYTLRDIVSVKYQEGAIIFNAVRGQAAVPVAIIPLTDVFGVYETKTVEQIREDIKTAESSSSST